MVYTSQPKIKKTHRSPKIMIQTTLLSHACLLFQSKETNLLTDPVFFDPHWEDINVLCPKRKLEIEKIPRIDILNISHRHQDHFDIRTLAYIKDSPLLAPDAVVLAPNDDILLEVLTALEFDNVKVVGDFEPLEIRDLKLAPTPSLNQDGWPEHGLAVSDGEVTIWNQVDTIVSPDIIQYLHKLCGRIDFAHLRFMPLLEGNFAHHKSLNLPFEEYSSFLKVANAVAPKFAVPGSAAFRYSDEYGFLNQYSFPTTPEGFLKDLKDFCPEIESSTFFSGDVAKVAKEGVEIIRQGSDFVSVETDDSLMVEFKPVMEVKPIRTLTGSADQKEEEKKLVKDFVENQLLSMLQKNEVASVWAHWKALYQLEVFEDEKEGDIWSIDFSSPEPKVVQGRLERINIYEGIAYSELARLIQKKTSWDFVGASAQYRTFNNIYRVEQGKFEYFPSEKKFPHPLTEAFPSDKDMDREKFMKDVRKWKGRAKTAVN